MFSIGEFSKITGLTIKTLRFYHDRGVLLPAWVDEQTGYRYYDARQIDKARIITQLRSLEFALEQIGEMLKNCDDEPTSSTSWSGSERSWRRRCGNTATWSVPWTVSSNKKGRLAWPCRTQHSMWRRRRCIRS